MTCVCALQVLLGNVAAAHQQVVSFSRELDAMSQLTDAQAAEYRQTLIAAIKQGYTQVLPFFSNRWHGVFSYAEMHVFQTNVR